MYLFNYISTWDILPGFPFSGLDVAADLTLLTLPVLLMLWLLAEFFMPDDGVGTITALCLFKELPALLL